VAPLIAGGTSVSLASEASIRQDVPTMSPLPLVLVLLPTVALAGPPRFVAIDPAHVQAAEKAWRAAVDCTGWEAPAHGQVEITREYVSGGYTGGAFLDRGGLYRIALSQVNADRSLVHEIAHAWARTGPQALNEGRADLLADCIASRVPNLAPLDPDPGLDLDAMPDLRTWENPTGSHSPQDLDLTRRDAYLGSARLMRVVATVVDAQLLWPRDGYLGWEDLERLLEDGGPAGDTVLAVLDGGVERQQAALSDTDRDGVPFLAEVLQGTNPSRWDSDGDGWWDGAAPSPSVAAIPLPPDGTPVCSGFAAGAGGATVQVLVQSQHRGTPPPWVRLCAGRQEIDADPTTGVHVPPGSPILIGLGGRLERSTGGAYALVGGQHLVADWNCRSTPVYTVWVEDPRATPLLDAFATELDEHVRRADAFLGSRSPARMVVALGARSTGVEQGLVQLSMGQVEWAMAQGRPDALAAVAVSLQRVWLGDDDARRWDAAEALARAIMDSPPGMLFVAVDEGAAEAWTGEATTCLEGWKGVLSGACAPPGRLEGETEPR